MTRAAVMLGGAVCGRPKGCMNYCDECVRLRDVLIEKLTAYGALLQAVIRAGNSESARGAQLSATRAGDVIGEAKARLDDHTESHR